MVNIPVKLSDRELIDSDAESEMESDQVTEGDRRLGNMTLETRRGKRQTLSSSTTDCNLGQKASVSF